CTCKSQVISNLLPRSKETGTRFPYVYLSGGNARPVSLPRPLGPSQERPMPHTLSNHLRSHSTMAKAKTYDSVGEALYALGGRKALFVGNDGRGDFQYT